MEPPTGQIDDTRPATRRSGTALLERDRELALLDALITGVGAGEAGAVLVEGPAGIGKSRLVAETRQRAAERGVRCLIARGSELERDFPYGVVRQLFEPLAADPSTGDRILAGAAEAARSVFAASAGEHPPEAGDASYSTLHGLYWLTLNLTTDGPVLLAVDDLHWCDRPSLRFLAYLVRRIEGDPVLVVGSLRPSEPGADAALLAELAGDPLVASVRPGPLSREAVRELVTARLGPGVEEPFVDACHASTGGNPLLLSELLKALDGERVSPTAGNVGVVNELGPRAASRAVLVRLARLPAEAVAVARALAVLGDGAETRTIARLAGLPEQATAEATATLIRAEILAPELPLAFVHPLVRAAVYHDLAPAARELEHERAAAILGELGAAPEQIATHLLVAPARGDVAVVETLREAARSAHAKGAPESAVASLRRALAEPPRPELTATVGAELGEIEVMTDAPAAAGHLRAAYEALTDPVARARAAAGLVHALLFTGDLGEAVAKARQARLALPPSELELAQRLESLELIAYFFGFPDDGGVVERLRTLRTIREGGAGARMLAALGSWAWTLDAGPAHEIAALASWAIADGVLLEADPGFLGVVAGIPLALADRDEAVAWFDAIGAEGYRRGGMFTSTGRMLWGGYTAFTRGELAEALDDFRGSLEAIALWGVPASAYSCGFVAQAAIEAGDLAEARRMLEQSEVPPPTSDRAVIVASARTELLLAEGNAEGAAELGASYGEQASWRRHPRYVPWRSQTAIALDRLGRREEALELAHAELEIARQIGAPGTLGKSLRVVGTIAREQGLPYLEEAIGVLESSPAKLERAKALAALGARLRHDRRPSDAREPLRRALELAEVCGARPLAEEVRAEIYATGARPRTSALTGVDALTASERRVAQLAADGRANREIAQELFVTPKTVEVHLSSAYRKLGIASRRDLARVLAPA